MNDAEKNKLWQEYKKSGSSQIREQLIMEYAQLVKIVAGRLNMYLGNNVEYDDLVGYGIFGLIDAIDKFNYDKNVKFETYASLRIRGAILDQIRKMDWIPRSLRQKQKKIDTAVLKIESNTGKVATDEEVAQELCITVEELNNWQGQTKASNIISLEEYTDSCSEIRIDSSKSERFLQPEQVVEKEKSVITLYYYEEMTLKEISMVLEVSESRVSQLHTKALNKMKLKLGEYLDILTRV